MTHHRYTTAEVAIAADLDPSTVEDWTGRGLIDSDSRYGYPSRMKEKPPMYSWTEALKFVVARALVAHGFPVHRACEITDLSRAGQANGQWPKQLLKFAAEGKAGAVYVFVIMARDSPGMYRVQVIPNPDVDVSALMRHYGAQHGLPNYNSVAVFDVGPYVVQALAALGLSGGAQKGEEL